MEPKDLVTVWDAPDHSVLTPKQISIRLPILVAAKISALCDLYPRKNRTEIIADLLATALDEIETALPSVKGEERGPGLPEHGMIYEDVGLRGRYWHSTEKYLRELEAQAKVKEPMKLPKPMISEFE